MQGHRRRRATQRSPPTPISPKGGGGTASFSLSLLLHDITDIASSSLRELDAVALATNVMVLMERDTKVPPTFRRVSALLLIPLQIQFTRAGHTAMTRGVLGLEQQISTDPSSGGSSGSRTYSTSPSSS